MEVLKTKPNILVVEDEAVIVLDIRSRLLQMGYTVAGTASAAKEAVDLAGRYRPGLVLMDIRLQGNSSGIEAADEIRRRFKLPVIFLTAHADEATIQQAKLTRPYGYILKPFNDQELHAAIEIALHRHEVEVSHPISDMEIRRELQPPPEPESLRGKFRTVTPSQTLVYKRLPLKSSKTEDEISNNTWRIVLIPREVKKPFIALEVFDNISIGRDDPGYLNLDLDLRDFDALNMGVSRQHAMIRVDRASLYLYDVGSTNGTYCNNKRAWLGNPLRLSNGDVIKFAALEFRLQVISSPDEDRLN